MERRFVDLEDAISEIVNRLDTLGEGGEDGSAVEDLNNRIDELEDHIAAEQAGIKELKGILSNIDQNLDQKLDTKSVEEKIKEVENVVHVITKRLEKHADKPAKIDEKIIGRVGDLEAELSGLKGEIGAAKMEMLKQKDVKKGPDFENIAHMEIGKLKQDLKDVERRIEQKIEVLKEGVDRNVSTAPAKDPDVEGIKRELQEMRTYREEIENAKARMDSLGESIGGLKSRIDNIHIPSGKFATLDHLAGFKREVDENRRGMDEKLKRLGQSSQQKPVRDDGEIRRLRNELNDIRTGLEQIGAELKGRVDRGEMKEIMKSFDGVGENPRLEKRVNDRFNDFNRRISGFDDKVENIEGRVNSIDQNLKGMMSRFDEKMKDSARKVPVPVQSPQIDKKLGTLNDELNNIRNNINNVRGETNNLKKVLVRMDERFSKQREVPMKGPDKELMAVTKGVGNRMGQLEKSLVKVRSRVNELSKQTKAEPIPAQDGYFREITDRLVFLESRLAALETLMQRPQPIVLE
jgi:predicted  nucleic acid-binding Zn-ribbon protein